MRLAFNSFAFWLCLSTSCVIAADLVSQPSASQEQHIENHAEEYDWFINAANGYDGVPYLLLKSFPEIEPDLWGPPAEEFSKFGFRKLQSEQSRKLPTGLAWDPMLPRTPNEPMPSIHKVTLTCSACHVGFVRRGDDVVELIGAPNTQIDVRAWRYAFESMAAKHLSSPDRIGKFAKQVIGVIDSKPIGHFYGNANIEVEKNQRETFKGNLADELTQLAQKLQVNKMAVDLQRVTSYSKDNHPPLNGGSVGQSDGSGDLVPKLLVVDLLASARSDPTPQLAIPLALQRFLGIQHREMKSGNATVTDILSTWRQGRHRIAQIDGSVRSPFFRNVAAMLAVTGNPQTVNAHNAAFSSRFLDELPPPAFPFDIDKTMAERGRQLFQKNCVICHFDGNEQIYQDLGVDPNRARVLNDSTIDLFLRHFKASVPPGFTYQDSTGKTIDPHGLKAKDIVNANRSNPEHQGYITDALEGVWARAPYLHNGSVPTLRHLLAPSSFPRPHQFVRGSISYDEQAVGFAWQPTKLSDYQKVDTMAAIFDCSNDGCSNRGHNRDVVVEGVKRKMDWSDDLDGLNALLEYLKTL